MTEMIPSYALYFVAVVTFGSHFGAATLSLQLRDFKLDQIQKYIKLFKVASKLAKAGLILEVIMVCTVSVQILALLAIGHHFSICFSSCFILPCWNQTWVLLLIALLQYLRKEMQGTRR